MASIEAVETKVKAIAEYLFGISRCMVRRRGNTITLDVWPEGEAIATYSFDYYGYVDEERSGLTMECDIPVDYAAQMIIRAMCDFLSKQK